MRFSALSVCSLLWIVAPSNAFTMKPASINSLLKIGSAQQEKQTRRSTNLLRLHAAPATKRPRSRVIDPSGPTEDPEEEELETIALEDIPELQYDREKHPIPHQPWRRGETAGCEDPIDAPWRIEAEDLIRKATEMVGANVRDVTWYLTHVLITLEEDWDQMPRDLLKSRGPVIDVEVPEPPVYHDPGDPSPEPIYPDQLSADGEPEVIYQRDMEHEEDIRSKMYALPEEGEEDLGLDDKEVPLYASQETREDDALRVAEEAELLQEQEQRPLDADMLTVNTAALSTIGGAILDVLEDVEDRLQILERHEIVLASPGSPGVLETQRQFDAHQNFDVAVETQDPWDSNRTLRGKLVDRNSMDIILNIKGRMVTVPQNFVKCVRLLGARRNPESEAQSFEESEEAYDAVEEEDLYEP